MPKAQKNLPSKSAASFDVKAQRSASTHFSLSLFLSPFPRKMASRPVLEAFEAKRIALEVR